MIIILPSEIIYHSVRETVDLLNKIKNINVTKTEEFQNDEELKRYYYLNNTVQIDRLVEIAKAFEDDYTCILSCECNSFNDDGCPSRRIYNGIYDLKYADFPSPYIDFILTYGCRKTGDYNFCLTADVNSNLLCYYIDKEKRDKREKL